MTIWARKVFAGQLRWLLGKYLKDQSCDLDHGVYWASFLIISEVQSPEMPQLHGGMRAEGTSHLQSTLIAKEFRVAFELLCCLLKAPFHAGNKWCMVYIRSIYVPR